MNWELGNDQFISNLQQYSRENLFPMQIAGLSVLTRLCKAPPPSVEYVLVQEDMHLKQILVSFLNNEYSVLQSPPYSNTVLCNLFGRPCYLFLAQAYSQTVVSEIELIRADVRTREVDSPETFAKFIETKTIPLDHDLSEDLSYFWRTLNIVTYLFRK